jgi:hypothetical protein
MSDEILLPDLLRRESRCFLQYVNEAFPWAHGKSEASRTTILHAATAEGAALAHLAQLLQRRHIAVPFFGAFPSAFTHYNYLTISSLIPKLIADQKRGLADLERDLPAVVEPEIRKHLELYRELKRKHIHELESI